jgi:hypothetical protein
MLVSGQTLPTFNLFGSLELVDMPPEATPVEAMMVGLHPLLLDSEIQARPGRDGKFVLKNVKPGRYSLRLPFPGRIRSFAVGPEKLAPDGFELKSSNVGFLRIIVSVKTSKVSVKVRGLAGQYTGAVALLSPSDPYLTLRDSCISNALTEPRTTFMFVPLGKYRVFIVDEKFQNDVAAYGPRFPEFLKDQATTVEVSEEDATEVTATYVDGRTVERAIHEAGPIR